MSTLPTQLMSESLEAGVVILIVFNIYLHASLSLGLAMIATSAHRQTRRRNTDVDPVHKSPPSSSSCGLADMNEVVVRSLEDLGHAGWDAIACSYVFSRPFSNIRRHTTPRRRGNLD